MKVKELMTAETVKSCDVETKLHEVAKIMKETNCGALPVVDREKRVVGIVTDRDICLALANQGVSAPENEVHMVMTHQVHKVKEDDKVDTVLREMRIYQVGRIPVVDEAGKLKGIVSVHNLLSQAGTSNGRLEMGSITSSGESLMKTIHAITDRYSKERVVGTAAG